MCTYDDVDRIVVQHTTFDHRYCAAQCFFGRLEQQSELSGEIFLSSRQDVGDSEQTGRVNVVAACVHHSGVHRGEGDLVVLCYGKSIDVGADHDPSSGLRAAKDSDRTGFGRASREFPSKIDETVSYDLSRALFLEREFGMSVKVMS